MLYSPSTGGFYAPGIHRSDVPEDAVSIAAEDYELLLKGQERGKQITPDISGYPTLIDPPAAESAKSVNQVINDKIREMAIVELKADGIIEADQNGKLVLTKKVRQ